MSRNAMHFVTSLQTDLISSVPENWYIFSKGFEALPSLALLSKKFFVKMLMKAKNVPRYLEYLEVSSIV